MQGKSIVPHIVLLALTAAATWALAFRADARYTGQAGVHEVLPTAVGDWRGEPLFYCQNAKCNRMFVESERVPGQTCPDCGSAIASGSPIEWSLLPADTKILKSLFTHATRGEQLVVSLVLGGESRTSIHRPQICLVGDGREITRTRSLSVREAHGRTLDVTLLELLWRRQSADGKWISRPSFYAYWFVAPHRQTARHDMRMFWMAFDRIFLGVSHRWAYIGVHGRRTEGSDAHVQLARSFIAELAPLMRNF
jgi:hypothetical protein